MRPRRRSVAPIDEGCGRPPWSVRRSDACSSRRSTLMNSRVPAEPRSASSRRRKHREALGQLPALQRPGDVERAGFAFQQGQVVARVVGRVFFGPSGVGGERPRSVPTAIATSSMPPTDGHVMMRVGGRDRVVVAVEPHQRQRVRLRADDPTGLERIRRVTGASRLGRSPTVRPWSRALPRTRRARSADTARFQVGVQLRRTSRTPGPGPSMLRRP